MRSTNLFVSYPKFDCIEQFLVILDSYIIVSLYPITMIALSNLSSFVDNMILEIMMMLNILLTNARNKAR